MRKSSVARKQKHPRKRLGVWDIVESVIDLVTALGVGTSAYWVWVFITAPSAIEVGSNGVIIKGVPFSYVVYSLFSMSLGGAYRSIKTLVLKTLA